MNIVEELGLKAVMTTAEVAAATGMTPGEIRRLNKEGVLPSLRGCRKPRKFSIVAVRGWLEGSAEAGKRRRR